MLAGENISTLSGFWCIQRTSPTFRIRVLELVRAAGAQAFVRTVESLAI
jgi:hypothetical protein